MRLVIEGELASKANSRRVITGRGRPRVIKSQKALDWTESALYQLKSQIKKKPLENKVGIECHVYYKTKRPDLDVSLLMDVLEKAGAYLNDRQVHEITAFKLYDKENPRVEVEVYEL